LEEAVALQARGLHLLLNKNKQQNNNDTNGNTIEIEGKDDHDFIINSSGIELNSELLGSTDTDDADYTHIDDTMIKNFNQLDINSGDQESGIFSDNKTKDDQNTNNKTNCVDNISKTTVNSSIIEQQQQQQNTSATTSNSNSTGGGYCVDSVEPKCNELKRLVEEIRFTYNDKYQSIETNQKLLQKLIMVNKKKRKINLKLKIEFNFFFNFSLKNATQKVYKSTANNK
jgi:hypothetical protein